MADSFLNPLSFTQYLAEVPAGQFECSRPIGVLVEQRLTQGDLSGVDVIGLFKGAGIKPLDGKLVDLLDVLTGDRTDIEGLHSMHAGLLSDDVAVVREGKNPFTLAIRVAGQWLALGLVRDDMQSILPLLVQTGSSPAERTGHARRTERHAEYQAGLKREADEQAARTRHGEELARRQLEAERVKQERRLGVKS